MGKPQSWESKDVVDEDGYSLYKKAMRDLDKRHKTEVGLLLNNLDKIVRMLTLGIPVNKISCGCFKNEGGGIHRISQTDKKMKESRLYVHVDTTTRTVWLLNAGTKERQDKDIQDARKLLENHRKRELEHERVKYV